MADGNSSVELDIYNLFFEKVRKARSRCRTHKLIVDTTSENVFGPNCKSRYRSGIA